MTPIDMQPVFWDSESVTAIATVVGAVAALITAGILFWHGRHFRHILDKLSGVEEGMKRLAPLSSDAEVRPADKYRSLMEGIKGLGSPAVAVLGKIDDPIPEPETQPSEPIVIEIPVYPKYGVGDLFWLGQDLAWLQVPVREGNAEKIRHGIKQVLFHASQIGLRDEPTLQPLWEKLEVWDRKFAGPYHSLPDSRIKSACLNDLDDITTTVGKFIQEKQSDYFPDADAKKHMEVVMAALSGKPYPFPEDLEKK